MKSILFFSSLLAAAPLFAQYEPPAGKPGSLAISKDSTAIVSWASACTVTLGYKDITAPAKGLAVSGTAQSAVGKAGTGGTLSLGDGGSAVLTFERAIANLPGPDFAVFENGFEDVITGLDFLEFAFVEVSSDGVHFVRFPALYSGDTTVQVDEFQTVDTRKYHNLAGKYVAGYGTPFDLEELKDAAFLDVSHVTHVKISDVIGTMDSRYASRDSRGVKINEPWPSAYNTGGFDLDAVGVLHQAVIAGLVGDNQPNVRQISPNPATDRVFLPSSEEYTGLVLTDMAGNVLSALQGDASGTVLLPTVPGGMYLLRALSANNSSRVYKIAIR